MARSIIKIYGDGEFWIDGQRKAKIYSDGEIFANGKKIGRIYEDGEIWLDNKKVGRVYEDGDLWIENKKVATGIYLLDLIDRNTTTSTNNKTSSSYTTKYTQYPKVSGGFGGGFNFGVPDGFTFVSILLIAAFIYACFALWFSELPEILYSNFDSLGPIAMVCVYVGMFGMMYLSCKKHTQRYSGKKADISTIFMESLLMQMGMFLFNTVVIQILFVVSVVSKYGFTLMDGFNEILVILGGTSIVGLLFALFGVALAPALVSTVISLYLIKKGYRFSNTSSKVKNPDINLSSISKTKLNPQSSILKKDKRTYKVSIINYILVAVVLIVSAAVPFIAYYGMWVLDYLPYSNMLWIPILFGAGGIIICYEKRINGFINQWLVQSVVIMIGNFTNYINLDINIDGINHAMIILVCSFIVGAVVTYVSKPIVEK